MCLSTVFCNLKSYELKYWECEQFNHSRVFLKVSAIGVMKHLSKSAVFGIDTGLLITFLGIPDPKIKCFIEKLTFLPSVFCLSQRNICTLEILRRRRRCLFKSRQAVVDMVLEVHFPISVFRILSRSPITVLLLSPCSWNGDILFSIWVRGHVLKNLWLQCPEWELTGAVSTSFNM